MRNLSLLALDGVGDFERGEWFEWTGYSAHVRRRLRRSEEAVIGPVVDLRGTDEGRHRFEAIKSLLNPRMRLMALEELSERPRT